jgi:hypothetical protein
MWTMTVSEKENLDFMSTSFVQVGSVFNSQLRQDNEFLSPILDGFNPP